MKIINTSDGHFFLKIKQGKKKNIIDLGFNDGSFERKINKIYDYNYVAFEANPIFKKSIKAKIYNFLIADKSNQMLDFGIDKINSGASSSVFIDKKDEIIKIKTINLKDAYKLSNFKHVDILKIDIEGGEYQILNLENIEFLSNNTKQIIVEFHDWVDQKLKPKTTNIINYFKKNDFYCKKFSFFTNASYLFINKKIIKLNKIIILKMSIFKYASGIKRIIQKNLYKFFYNLKKT